MKQKAWVTRSLVVFLGGLLMFTFGAEVRADDVEAMVAEVDRLMTETQDLMQAADLRSRAFELAEKGKIRSAERLFRESLSLAQKHKHGEFERISHEFLGALFLHVGQYAQAKKSYQDMLGAAQGYKDPVARSLAESRLGSIAILQGDLAKAEGYFRAVAHFAKKEGHLELFSEASMGLGFAAYADGAYRQAQEHWQRAIDATGQQSAVPARIAGLQLECLARASAMLNQQDNALRQAELALKTAANSGLSQDLSTAHETLGFVHFRAGRLHLAEQHLRTAREHYANVRRSFDLQIDTITAFDLHSVEDDLLLHVLDALTRQGPSGQKEAEMLLVADTSKAPAFASALADSTGRARSQFDVQQLRQTAQSQGVAILQYALLYDPTALLVPDRLRGHQADKEALLLTWLVRPDGTIKTERIDLAQRRESGAPSIQALVEASRRQLGVLPMMQDRSSKPVGLGEHGLGGHGLGEQPEDDQVWRDLYRLLIEPIEAHLPVPSNNPPEVPAPPLVIIPHGVLALVPFAALEDADGSPLVERAALQLAASIETLALIDAPAVEIDSADVLVVGDPQSTEETQDLEPLPGARREAEIVARRFRVKPLIGEHATKQAVSKALGRASLVHLACHGLLEYGGERSPWRGALALASKNGSGLLTAQEVAELHLSTRLTVLSACDTGGGRVSAEGILGLARAFLSAGSRGVVMSLWRVDDAATLQLMSHFYAYLEEGEHPALALRKAQLATRTEFPNPRFWAAFTYFGSPG